MDVMVLGYPKIGFGVWILGYPKMRFPIFSNAPFFLPVLLKSTTLMVILSFGDSLIIKKWLFFFWVGKIQKLGGGVGRIIRGSVIAKI